MQRLQVASDRVGRRRVARRSGRRYLCLKPLWLAGVVLLGPAPAVATPGRLAPGAMIDHQVGGSTPAAIASSSSGYCAWVEGKAASASALLLAPELFTLFGVLNAYTNVVDAAAQPQVDLTPRLMVGLRYDLLDLFRGLGLRARARAECRRFLAAARLRDLVEGDGRAISRRALGAQLALLEQAMPRAEEMLQEARLSLKSGQSDVIALNATQLRVDALQGLLERVRADLRSLPPSAAERVPLAALLASRRAAELEQERVEAGLRRANAFKLELRGGYDHFFGRDNEVPFFATVTAALNLGHLWQYGADARSGAGRRRWAEQEGDTDRSIGALLRRLRATERSERRRLSQTKTILADVTQRLQSVSSVRSRKIKDYRDYLWFEWVRLSAEHAFLHAHTADLALALDGLPEAGKPGADGDPGS